MKAADELNIDDFCHDVGKILTLLHQVFPRPIILSVDDICGPEETDEFGIHSNRYLACFSTMLWLAEEGYLRFAETLRNEGIDQAVLSARCFAHLTRPRTEQLQPINDNEDDPNRLPESIRLAQTSVVAQLRQALGARSSTATRHIVLALIDAMLGNTDS